jgi:hypothetical protein
MSENSNRCDNRLETIKKTVKSYPDFPKKGVLFRYYSKSFIFCKIIFI